MFLYKVYIFKFVETASPPPPPHLSISMCIVYHYVINTRSDHCFLPMQANPVWRNFYSVSLFTVLFANSGQLFINLANRADGSLCSLGQQVNIFRLHKIATSNLNFVKSLISDVHYPSLDI